MAKGDKQVSNYIIFFWQHKTPLQLQTSEDLIEQWLRELRQKKKKDEFHLPIVFKDEEGAHSIAVYASEIRMICCGVQETEQQPQAPHMQQPGAPPPPPHQAALAAAASMTGGRQ